MSEAEEIVGSRYVRTRWPFGKLCAVELQRKVAAGIIPPPFKFSDRLARDGRSRQRNWWRRSEVDTRFAELVARAGTGDR